MAAPELKEGQQLIAKGEIDKAIELFRVLSLQKSNGTVSAEALHALAAMQFQKNPTKETAKDALQSIDSAIAQLPTVARFHNTRGIVLEKTGRAAEALQSFEKALQLEPNNPKYLLNTAKALRGVDRYQEALTYMLKVAEIEPKHPEINHKIGTLYKAMNQKDKALQYFRREVEVNPSHDYSKFWISALTGEGQKDVFKPQMVARLFDSYADSFDSHLVQTLGYRTPDVLFQLLRETLAARDVAVALNARGAEDRTFKRCCDLGCGTGLMGVILRPYCDVIEGVDLSAGMIDQARKREGVYDLLAVDECVAFLDRVSSSLEAETSTPSSGYDLLVAADVLVYLSDLEPIFTAARFAAAKGATFAFSTEHLDLGSEEAQQAPRAAESGYLLRATGRYAHAREFVEQCLAKSGWRVERVLHTELRKNLGAPVMGDLFVCTTTTFRRVRARAAAAENGPSSGAAASDRS